MKTAKEMFEELGYIQVCDDSDFVQYQQNYTNLKHETGYTNIVFNKSMGIWYVTRFVNLYEEGEDGVNIITLVVGIDLELGNALFQQLKELEWVK